MGEESAPVAKTKRKTTKERAVMSITVFLIKNLEPE